MKLQKLQTGKQLKYRIRLIETIIRSRRRMLPAMALGIHGATALTRALGMVVTGPMKKTMLLPKTISKLPNHLMVADHPKHLGKLWIQTQSNLGL